MKEAHLTMVPGDRLVIRGPNGSGKTTLLKAVLGLLPTAKGTILLEDSPVGSAEWKLKRSLAAWVPQEGVLHRFPVAAEEAVAVGLAGQKMNRRQRRDLIHRSLEQVGAGHLAGRCFHRLSGGERQRVSLARCLAQGADLLLLDEPATALDAEGKESLAELVENLAAGGRAVLAVTHDSRLFSGGGWRQKTMEEGYLC